MKKFLSVILALAVVASCLAAFCLTTTATSAGIQAVKVTGEAAGISANSIIFKAPFLTEADFGSKDMLPK